MPQPLLKKILILLCISSLSLCFSQKKNSIYGTVIDINSLRPITGVIITIQNTSSFEITDSLGVFNFDTSYIGKQLLRIKHQGYQTQLLPVSINSVKINLGTILLSRKTVNSKSNHTIGLNSKDLLATEDTDAAIIVLHSRKDVFQRAAAFSFGSYRFRKRGLDNSYSTVSLNGMLMNKFRNNRPEWNNWGGLNDITRNMEFTIGTKPSDFTFGNLSNSQNISTRASDFRPQSKISFANTNSHYKFRTMATHSTGLSKKGWAFVVTVSRRWANEGYFEGTSYKSNSFLVSVEKTLNSKHSINLTGLTTPIKKGKNSYNNIEVTDIKGLKYNSYWGYQNGQKRNSRIKSINEPILLFSHYWTISDKTNLQTNTSYQFGHQSNSRLDYANANNPNPSYYKNLPSYYLNLHDTDNNYTPDYIQANHALTHFTFNSQINWDNLYQINQQNTESVYIILEDKFEDQLIHLNTILFSEITPHINLQAGLSYRKLNSENYSELNDLLGGAYFTDTDSFLSGDAAQSNLATPDRKIFEGDKFGYHYTLSAQSTEAFAQLQFSYPKWDLYWSQMINHTQYQRQGHYQNGLYPSNSLGNSEQLQFQNLGSKIGVIYKASGHHFFELNLASLGKAPTLRNSFSNTRINNAIPNNLTNESLTSIDLGYQYKSNRIKSRITGYYSKIKNSTKVSYYYTEGLGILQPNNDSSYINPNAFVTETTSGIEKTNIGVEFSFEYKINSSFKAYAAANWGQYIYSKNPNLYLNIDNLSTEIDLGPSLLKNYRQPGMPQQAYSVGLEYRSSKYWWISTNVNYLDDNYLSVSPLLRTDNFFINPDDYSQYPFEDIDSTTARDLLRQEKLDEIFTLNILGGKSWKVKKKIFGLFIVINNLLNQTYRIGGFEQSRNANYQEILQSRTGPIPSFGNNYAYGFGRTYYLNLYIRL